jgi:DNA polymerase III epsilon subunit-like protein
MNNIYNTRKNISKHSKSFSEPGLNPNAKPFIPLLYRNTIKNINNKTITNKTITNKTITNKTITNKTNNNRNIRNKTNNITNVMKHFKLPSLNPNNYIAIDCEMVGVGPKKQSALAEVSLVDINGKEIYHSYVKPDQYVTDYRTFVSGITPQILKEKGQSLYKVRQKVKDLLEGKIIVGHGLQNDLLALGLDIPKSHRWDTTEIPIFMRSSYLGGPLQPKKLKTLVKNYLGRNIQTGEHSATEDAIGSIGLLKWYITNIVIPNIIKYDTK